MSPLLLLMLAACDAPATDAGGLALELCHVQGVGTETFCGVFEVYEDREAGAGRIIPLRVVLVPAVSPDPEPDPLFFLAGGPGQAASELIAAVMPTFNGIHKSRDLIFVDQRGTGSSNPLDCESEAGDTLAGQFASSEMDPEAMERCRDSLDADLTKYTTPFAMDDLDDLRAAMGYDTLNLYGASYGTRAALVYMRRHPERVRSVILDGVVPTEMEVFLHFARDGQDAWDALVRDCHDQKKCAETFPELSATLDGLLASMEEEPIAVTVRHPLTGAPEAIEVGRDAFAAHLRGLLYAPQITPLLPLALTQASQGEYEPFVAQSAGISGGTSDTISLGMMLSVVCAEDLPRITPGMREDAAKGTFLGDSLVAMMAGACQDWPIGDLPEGYNAPVQSEAPTLVLSGALDPATPPRWGEQALRGLPNGVHAIAPGAGHNVSPLGCTPRRMTDFIEAGTAADLDLSCIGDIKRPDFFIDFAGPAE